MSGTATPASGDPSGRMAVIAAGAAALSTFAAGTTLAAIRFLAGEADPLTITIVRIGLGAAILVPLALLFGRGWPRGRQLAVVAMWGILLFAVSQWLISIALAHTSAARGGIIASSVPFITLVLAVSVRAERLTALKVAGVTVATAGVVLALWRDASAVPGGWRGDAIMLLAATLFSIYNVATRGLVRRYPPLVWIATNMLAGFAVLLAIGLFSGASLDPTAYSGAGLLAFAYIGLPGSALAYFLWLWALRHTTPTRVAVALTMNPVGAIAAAAIALGEPITPGMLVGVVGIVAGIVMANWRARPVVVPKPPPAQTGERTP